MLRCAALEHTRDDRRWLLDQPIHLTFNRQPKLFRALDRRRLAADQFQPPGDQARTPAALAARAQPLRRWRHARLTILPVTSAGVTWMNRVPIPGAQGTTWSIGHSPMTCCGTAAAWACPCTTTLLPVRDRWSRSSTSSATAQGWTSSDKIPWGTFQSRQVHQVAASGTAVDEAD
jgi:hypothetical protein